jgi:hypothetical protein
MNLTPFPKTNSLEILVLASKQPNFKLKILCFKKIWSIVNPLVAHFKDRPLKCKIQYFKKMEYFKEMIK